jgi:(p)ppGpp synthase/HD superfamily hydrolase
MIIPRSVKLAIELAEKFHAGQTYGVMAYTAHLQAVRSSVTVASPNDERLEVIAILHDILEDTTCPPEVLTALFEDKIVDAVWALTKGKEEPRSDYLQRVKGNPLALIVKRHDALCNLTESLKRGDMKRVAKYADVLKELCQ